MRQQRGSSSSSSSYLFDPTTMEPLVKSPAMARALDTFRRLAAAASKTAGTASGAGFDVSSGNGSASGSSSSSSSASDNTGSRGYGSDADFLAGRCLIAVGGADLFKVCKGRQIGWTGSDSL